MYAAPCLKPAHVRSFGFCLSVFTCVHLWLNPFFFVRLSAILAPMGFHPGYGLDDKTPPWGVFAEAGHHADGDVGGLDADVGDGDAFPEHAADDGS